MRVVTIVMVASLALPTSALTSPAQAQAVLNPIATLSGDAPANQVDGFGASIATDQNWLFIGAPRERSARNLQDGALYIYQRQPNGAYQRTQKIPGTQSSAAAGDRLGAGVAASNGWLFVAAANNQDFPGMTDPRGGTPPFSFAGKVLVYRLNAGSRNWEFVQALASPQPGTNGAFGARTPSNHIAIGDNADIVVIGEPINVADAVTGRMHVFRRQGQSWSLQQSIDVATDTPATDFFAGDSIVALPGDRFAVEVNASSIVGGNVVSAAGQIRVYERSGSGLNPVPVHVLNSLVVDIAQCALDGGVYAGMSAGGKFFAAAQPCAAGTAGAKAGLVNVFAYNRSPNALVLKPDSAFEGTAAGNLLGSSFGGQESISLDDQGRRMLVAAAGGFGSPDGADVLLFTRQGNGPWKILARLQPQNPTQRFGFGQAAVFGHPATGLGFVGQFLTNDAAPSKGAVHVYAIPGN